MRDPAVPREPLLVWCAGVDWDDLQGTDKSLVTRIADHHEVLWVDPPRSVVRSFRDGSLGRGQTALRPRRPAPHVFRLSPLAPPFPYRAGVGLFTAWSLGRSIKRWVRRADRTVSAVVATNPHPRLTMFPGAVRVYYATDDFAAGAHLMGLPASGLERAERRRLEEADVLMSVSSEIGDRWSVGDRPLFVLPNGCDPGHFADVDQAPLPPDVDLPPPIAGMVGQLSPRIDLALLEAVADADISLLLVGPLSPAFEPARTARLMARPNVRWVGQKRYDELPSYLRVVDVGLTPYVDDPFNRASFPLKTLEYLSAGRGVVATRLPAVERLGTSLIRVASGTADFVQQTRRALEEPRTASLADQRRAFATAHSWAERAQQFLALVETVRPVGR